MRSILLLAVLIALGGCHTADEEHTGNRPLGRRRAPDYDGAMGLDERLQAREAQGRKEMETGGREIDPAAQVIGAHATRVYHVEGCDLLDGLGRPERVIFVSGYDALDGGYKPCPRCRPGP